MGHSRLGKIPTTKAWKAVVGTYAGSDGGHDGGNFAQEVERIAAKAMEASASLVRAAKANGGVTPAFFLLTQIALAARRPNFLAAMEQLGILLTEDASSLDLSIEVHRVLDDTFFERNRRSDIGEMAQLALGEALAAYLRTQPRDMFADNLSQLQRDLRSLGTQKGFGEISQEFFGNLIGRLLNFNLSRIVCTGEGQSLIGDVDDLTKFNTELRQHSRQRAAIVRDFAAKWFSKTEFEVGIDPHRTKRFVAHALTKLEDEFKRGVAG